jgi:CheY-like chemotaxis protein
MKESRREIQETTCFTGDGKSELVEKLQQLQAKTVQTCSTVELLIKSFMSTYWFLNLITNRYTESSKIAHSILLNPHLVILNLRETIATAVNCFSDLQDGRDCNIKIDFIDESIATFIETDQQWLQDNLLSLLSNAMKFSKFGTTSYIRAFFTAAPCFDAAGSGFEETDSNELHSDVMRIEVEDCGYGLRSSKANEIVDLWSDEGREEVRSVFQDFSFAGKHGSNTGGASSGLFCLAKRIEALHGEYGISPRPYDQDGLIVWFTIPYLPSKLAVGSKDNGEASEADAARPFKILVVDDSSSILKTLKFVLEKHDFNVSTASNGHEALLRLCGRKEVDLLPSEIHGPFTVEFDAMLLDLQMPILDGIETTKKIREIEREFKGNSLFIIAMSAADDNESIERAYDAGVNYYLPKPFNFLTFQKVLYEKHPNYNHKI